LFSGSERLNLILALAGLVSLWSLTLLFFSFDKTRYIAYIASGFLFILSFGLLLLFLKKTLRPSRPQKTVIGGNHVNLNLSSSPTKRHPKESEFLSQTFESVLAQMQEQQKELTALQNKLNERAVSAEVFSHHVVNSLPSGLIAFDAQGLVRIANAPANELFPSLQTEDKSKISFREVFQPCKVLVDMVAESLQSGKISSRIELDYQTHNRSKRLGLTIAPLEIDKEICGVLCLAADITEIALLREQSERQRNLESLGVMSAGLAHELKNSLATLHSYSQFLGRTAQNESSQKASTALTTEIRSLSEMINSFLNFARPQSLSLTTIDLAELIADCCREASLYAREADVLLEVKGEFERVQADSTMLRQTILNLIRNAIEAASQASIKLVEVKGYISTDESMQKWTNIEVSDTGDGIKAKDMEFIFVPFFTTKQQGHGIGLAIAHRIITQHGGILTAANKQDGGAVFTIKLKTY
jgi:signal transduction histidine kinase